MAAPLDTPDPHLSPEVAARYDTSHADRFRPDAVDPAVDLLAGYADGAPAVEFAIGTGRLAVPLAERGVKVSGMDISQPMLDQLAAKPEAAAINAVLGDMTSTLLGTDFGVAYLVYNTIMNLRSQAQQVACFRNAAAHLRPGGRFVVEVMVPEVAKLIPGERFVPFAVEDGYLGIDEYADPLDQILISHHYVVEPGSERQVSAPFRYVWPSELDLMAQLAGLEREHRWATWTGEPFTAASQHHVSVWRKPST
jgi:SAM-dependent methyltransferase